MRWPWFGRSSREYEEELRVHVEMEADENVERGLSPQDARLAALRRFGSLGAARERLREGRPLYWLETLWQDIRFGARQIRRSPLVACAVVLTLTLGIASNTGIFTLLNGELFRPRVDQDPRRFLRLSPRYEGPQGARFSAQFVTYADYLAMRSGAPSVAELAAWNSDRLTLDQDDAVRIPAMLVSCNFFTVYGLERPKFGRLFRAEECASPGAAPVVLLTEELWRNHYGADPGIVGRVIGIGHQSLTVVGVVPERFLGSHEEPGVFIPFTMRDAFPEVKTGVRRNLLRDPTAAWLRVDGLLHAGRSRTAAAAELRVIAAQQDQLQPGRKTVLGVTDGSEIAENPRVWPAVAGVMGALTLILLITCANVSVLMLSKAAARKREIALRLALGAGRLRLLRMLLVESLLPAAAAAGISAWLAYYTPLLVYRLFRLPSPVASPSPDWLVFTYLVAAALLAGCLAGLAPALESLKVDLVASLKGQERLYGSGGRRWRLSDVLAAVQVALCLILLAGAGVILRATYRVAVTDPGFETKQALVVWSPVSMPPYTKETAEVFYRSLSERLRSVPGIESVGFAKSIQAGSPEKVRLPERLENLREASSNDVSPEFFFTLRIPIVLGRGFTDQEALAVKPAVTVVSQELARTFWPGQNPLSKRILDGAGNQLEVVGVSRDTHSMLFQAADVQFYRPMHPRTDDDDLLIRFAGDPGPVQQAVRSVIRELDPAMTPAPLTLEVLIERSLRPFLVMAKIALVLGGIALLLAIFGIYGVVAFGVTQRQTELGIRMALGASRADVHRLVFGLGLRTVRAGLLAGLPLAVAFCMGISKVIRDARMLLNPLDPLPYAAVAVVLTLAALAAMLGPARRAATSDPVAALRQD